MTTLRLATALVIALLTQNGEAFSQGHQRDGAAGGHGGPKLFLAQLAGNKVIPASNSSATGTGAFIFDPGKRTVSYDLTFQGLEHGAPRNVALYNFDEGGRGALIHTVCGSRYPACPISPSGNVTGTWGGEAGSGLDTKLLPELASARIYVEIVGGDGKPEIRGQLEPNDAMLPVQNYAAHLMPVTGTNSRGVGTAVVSEVQFPDGPVAVFYQVTVANTSGAPRKAALTRDTPPAGSPATGPPSQNVLPKQRLLPSRAAGKGGTLTGEYETNVDQGDVLVTRLRGKNERDVGIIVVTDGFPGGELFGVLRPLS